jgi:hypothetical protein
MHSPKLASSPLLEKCATSSGQNEEHDLRGLGHHAINGHVISAIEARNAGVVGVVSNEPIVAIEMADYLVVGVLETARGRIGAGIIDQK